ncbi:MAG: long-chain-fatty-acid--CoA ligase [Campylobacterales bacterium]|nr:long-chain-fatty-acid--CoA ligase [Campylobacterales bacterium]
MSSKDEEYLFFSFYEMIASHASRGGKKTALFLDKRKISYKELLGLADTFAAYLNNRGVGKGDNVTLFLRNSIEYVITLIALSKLGAVSVPTNTFLKSEELHYILEDCNAKMLIASAIHEKVVREGVPQRLQMSIVWEGELDDIIGGDQLFSKALEFGGDVECRNLSLDDLSLIFYTSGTTGKPKGAMLSYRNVFSNSIAGSKTIGVHSKDRAIVFLPMFHSFTLSIGVILMLYVKGSIVIIQSVQPFSNIFKQTLLKRVTIFFGIPDLYSALVKTKLPWYFMYFNAIRIFVSGASALQEKTLNAMKQKFKRTTLIEGYGLSEASPAVCVNIPRKTKAKSVGPALQGYEIKIVDENLLEVPMGKIGDIITKGDNVMQGYLGKPEATAETVINGWLLTGDMGYVDEDGYLFIVDRKKDLIISKGINIYPREIEDVLDMYSGIKASAVIGVLDEQCGEIPIAYIELEEDVKEIQESEVKRYLKEHIANYKIPKHIYTINELPKNATGKVLKRVLKQEVNKEKIQRC